jgi:hypothetical protein
VSLPGIEKPVKLFSRLEQGIHQLHHLGGMDVAIDGAILFSHNQVPKSQFSYWLFRDLHRPKGYAFCLSGSDRASLQAQIHRNARPAKKLRPKLDRGHCQVQSLVKRARDLRFAALVAPL